MKFGKSARKEIAGTALVKVQRSFLTRSICPTMRTLSTQTMSWLEEGYFVRRGAPLSRVDGFCC